MVLRHVPLPPTDRQPKHEIEHLVSRFLQPSTKLAMGDSKAILIVGGPSRGTRFRPLSLDVPKVHPIASLTVLLLWY